MGSPYSEAQLWVSPYILAQCSKVMGFPVIAQIRLQRQGGKPIQDILVNMSTGLTYLQRIFTKKHAELLQSTNFFFWKFSIWYCVSLVEHDLLESALQHTKKPTCLFVCLVDWLVSLRFGSKPGCLADGCQDWRLTILRSVTQRQSGESMMSVPASHIIRSKSKPGGSGRYFSNPRPPDHESCALPTDPLSPLKKSRHDSRNNGNYKTKQSKKKTQVNEIPKAMQK